MQKRPLKFSPVNGASFPVESFTAGDYRARYPDVVWLYNPWTGRLREQADTKSDPHGLAIVPPGEDPRPFEVKLGTGMPNAVWKCMRCETTFAGARCPSCHNTDLKVDVAAAREALHDAAEQESIGNQVIRESINIHNPLPKDRCARHPRYHLFPFCPACRGEAEQIPGVKSVDSIIGPEPAPAGHPLQDVFALAIEQATRGKGVRHGGEATPFLEQPWVHYGKMHGRGFLTGQAAKKLEEAASTRQGDAFITEALGALVYIGMAILKEQGKV